MPVRSPKRLQLPQKELKALQERIKKRALLDSDWDKIHAMSETVETLSQVIEEKNTSIGRLCKYLLGAPTETARNILKLKEKSEEKLEAPLKKQKGHGKKPASAYEGATRVIIEHSRLAPKDPCPECEKGKLYELAMPSVFVHITGNAPLKATVYERTRLRCNLCGEVFTPALPVEVGDNKHDESAAAMLALLKYGCGMPLNRLEKLQGHLGNPLAASTQWDILNASAIHLAPVYDALVEHAAQGQLLHNDDTTMKVLSLLKEPDTENNRTGIFTSGIVSIRDEHRVALFMTGRQHAGENLTELLKQRATGLAPPIQMCDALSRNASKDFETIMANCLSHARRQFVELVNRFPEECEYVIKKLGTVYHHDAITKQQALPMDERLKYHQIHSGPLMADLNAWCNRQIGEKLVEPNSGLGKAIHYMLRHWEKLSRFLHVPGAPLDNNICEQALKHAILHRKNALFYKTQRGAKVGDLFMSLIHTCQMAGINPLDYLTWLLKQASKLILSPSDFLPWNYNPQHP